MEQISVAEFFVRLQKNRKLESIELTDNFEAQGNYLSFREVENCTFKNLSLKTNNDQIIFRNCVLQEVNITVADARQKFFFENCRISSLQLISSEPLSAYTLRIIGDKTEVPSVAVLGNLSFLEITDCSTIGNVTLNAKIQLAKISNLHNSTRLNTKEAEITKLSISNCTSLDFYPINSNIDEIFVSKCRFGQFNLKKIKSSGQLIFSETEKLTVDFDDCEIDNIIFRQGSFEFINFRGYGQIKLKTEVYQNRIDIHKINFEDYELKSGSHVNFSAININGFRIGNLRNNGRLILKDIDVKGYLNIMDSDLGKMDFNNTSILSEAQFNLIDSNISEARFNNLRWPNKEFKLSEAWNPNDPLMKSRFKKELDFKHSLRDSYRQLKSNYSKIDNKITALEFQKNEMRMMYQIVNETKLNSFRDFGNFLIVWTHKASSDFSQSIGKPFFRLFTFHSILFAILILTHPDLNLRIGGDVTWEATRDGISKYFQTLLPTHAFTLTPYSPSANLPAVTIGGFWDFLIRISSAYFVFYFISASRKYHQ